MRVVLSYNRMPHVKIKENIMKKIFFIIICAALYSMPLMALELQSLTGWNNSSYSGPVMNYNNSYYTLYGTTSNIEVIQYVITYEVIASEWNLEGQKDSGQCTGTIMPGGFLLTAQHCIKPVDNKYSPDQQSRTIQILTSSRGDLNGQELSTSQALKLNSQPNLDVAKVQLSNTANLNLNTLSDPLNSNNEIALPTEINNSPIIIFGGSTLTINSPLVSNPSIPLRLVIYNYSLNITPSTPGTYIYAGGLLSPNIFTCSGDSGGPLLLKQTNPDGLELIGIHVSSEHPENSKCSNVNKRMIPINGAMYDAMGLAF